MKYCINCGTEFTSNSLFCSNCGVIRYVDNPPETDETQGESKRNEFDIFPSPVEFDCKLIQKNEKENGCDLAIDNRHTAKGAKTKKIKLYFIKKQKIMLVCIAIFIVVLAMYGIISWKINSDLIESEYKSKYEHLSSTDNFVELANMYVDKRAPREIISLIDEKITNKNTGLMVELLKKACNKSLPKTSRAGDEINGFVEIECSRKGMGVYARNIIMSAPSDTNRLVGYIKNKFQDCIFPEDIDNIYFLLRYSAQCNSVLNSREIDADLEAISKYSTMLDAIKYGDSKKEIKKDSERLSEEVRTAKTLANSLSVKYRFPSLLDDRSSDDYIYGTWAPFTFTNSKADGYIEITPDSITIINGISTDDREKAVEYSNHGTALERKVGNWHLVSVVDAERIFREGVKAHLSKILNKSFIFKIDETYQTIAPMIGLRMLHYNYISFNMNENNTAITSFGYIFMDDLNLLDNTIDDIQAKAANDRSNKWLYIKIPKK